MIKTTISMGVALLLAQGAFALEVDREDCPEKVRQHCYEREMGVLPPASFEKAVNGTIDESDEGATEFFDEVEDCCAETIEAIIKKRQEKRE